MRAFAGQVMNGKLAGTTLIHWDTEFKTYRPTVDYTHADHPDTVVTVVVDEHYKYVEQTKMWGLVS